MKAFAPAILFMMAACSSQAEQEQSLFYTDQSMHDFMNKVMQPAAEGVWDRTGYLTNEDGFQDLFPHSEAEWLEAEQASLIVAELSNVLSIPGRRVEKTDWDQAVEAVRMTSLAAADAAARRDQDDFMQAALALNNACQSCHMKYDRPTEN